MASLSFSYWDTFRQLFGLEMWGIKIETYHIDNNAGDEQALLVFMWTLLWIRELRVQYHVYLHATNHDVEFDRFRVPARVCYNA